MQFIVKIIMRDFTSLFFHTESLKSCGYLPTGTSWFGWGMFDSLRGRVTCCGQHWLHRPGRHRREQLCLQTSPCPDLQACSPEAPTAPTFSHNLLRLSSMHGTNRC